ncbi:MAG: flagellar protein FliS [Fimbriimonadales bacterium]|nr:MAG: flagellar protein FliS [Fimbriimonadales bacterium]
MSTEFRSAIGAYRKQAVETARPIDLVVMLYDGLLQSLRAAKGAIEERNLDRQNSELLRAQRILSELTAGLDMEKGGEISKNLASLYHYCIQRLIEANIEDDATRVEEVVRVIKPLRDAWAEAAQKPQEDAIGTP